MKTYKEYMDHYYQMSQMASSSLAKVEAYESVLSIIDDDRVRQMMREEINRGKALLDEAKKALHEAAELSGNR